MNDPKKILFKLLKTIKRLKSTHVYPLNSSSSELSLLLLLELLDDDDELPEDVELFKACVGSGDFAFFRMKPANLFSTVANFVSHSIF